MRDTLPAALAAILICIFIPAAAAAHSRSTLPPQETVSTAEEPVQTQPAAKITETQMSTEAAEQAVSFDDAFRLPVLFESGVDSVSLHDYLVGALAGELPMNFNTEALKAQAVACRTYALRQYDCRKHDPAAVCTVSSCCECWKSTDGLQPEAVRRAEEAVRQTDGLVLTYDAALIEATFFSCSGGRTETAADVWGSEIAYLQSVDSPGEEAAPRYTGTVEVSAEDFKQSLLTLEPTLTLQGTAADWLGEVTHTVGGGVGTVQIGNAAFTGKQLRKLFGLNSTDFQISSENGCIVFSTKGFGHRVGMSQYGAQAMAENGADFTDILTHYYTGASISDCRDYYTIHS